MVSRDELGGVTIELTAVDTLSYALAHARQPVVDEIVLHRRGPGVRAATVSVTISDALGPLADPYEAVTDLAEDGTTVLRDLRLTLNPALMLRVDERRPGRIEVVVRRPYEPAATTAEPGAAPLGPGDEPAGAELGRAVREVTLLAHDQWIAAPLQLGLELLAAHVQPNAPVVAEVMTAASDLLRSRTGSSSLATYQLGDPARIDTIVEAVFDTIRARDLRYAQPPASWGGTGQRIRNPEEVLVGRLGTCLDTTLTLAAVLEQCGINATLWVFPSHSVLGYWRTDSSLPVVAWTDPVEVVNLADDGTQLGLVETTLLTGGGESGTFAEARAEARRLLMSGPDPVLGVTDVRQAREHRIWPLPVRTTDPAGATTVVEYVPPVPGPHAAPAPQRPAATPTTVVREVPPRVANWKNSLLDLSLRNQLVNFPARAGIELVVPESVIGSLEDRIHEGRSLQLLADDQLSGLDAERGITSARDLPEGDLQRLLLDRGAVHTNVAGLQCAEQLRRLAARARTVIEETGANTLHLALGIVQWRRDDRELRAPLVLVPVTLTTTNRGRHYRLSLDEAGSSTPNYCLLEVLRTTYGLEIPELVEPASDGSGIDLAEAFRATRAAFTRANLPFRVLPTAHLAILQFAKFRLWKDLDDNWETLARNSLVGHLVHSHLQPYADPVASPAAVDLDELGLACPVPADASQLAAIAEATQGRTFVLEGPPGTGKSQTITNLLARCLAGGQKVLFVAEKRAALDVVRRRLEEVGLGDFALDLHDKGARPTQVRAQVERALDLRHAADDGEYRVALERARTGVRTLGRYADRLHSPNSAGLSLYAARSRLLATEPGLAAVPVPVEVLATTTAEQLDEVRAAVRLLPEPFDAARPAVDHPWGFLDPAAAGRLTVGTVHVAGQRFDRALAAAQAAGLGLPALDTSTGPDDLDRWARLADAPRHPTSYLMLRRPEEWAQLQREVERRIALLRGEAADWLAWFDPEFVADDLTAVAAAARAADDAGFFARKRRRREVLASVVGRVRTEPHAVPLKQLGRLVAAAAQSRADVLALRDTVRQAMPTVDVDSWNPLQASDPSRPDDTVTLVLRAVAEVSEDLAAGTGLDDPARAVRVEHYSATPASPAQAAALTELADAWRALAAQAPVRAEVADWLAGHGFLAAWQRGRSARNIDAAEPVTLQAWLALLHTTDPLRTAGLADLHHAVLAGQVDVDTIALALDKGLAAASVEERARTQSLDRFDVAGQATGIRRFTESSHTVRAELATRIPADVIGTRTFDAWAATGQIAALRRQLQRRRGGMSVRQLLENYGDLITTAMPLTLVSPESVARFFPAREGLFDVVVFDEASQVRVADAVGAMGRGRSVVVVGDSKQLPPTSFAQLTGGLDIDEYEFDTVADEESILSECVQAQVPRLSLTWHYRSQDETLIAFSNRQYYDGRLSTFPSPRHLGDVGRPGADGHGSGYGVSLVRVPGHFERSGRGRQLRTNRVEAEAIVAEVVARFAASPMSPPSLGIITFNAQQRDLIEDLLRATDDERIASAVEATDGLFVKNLENVQGDERDTILFSVAFSANDRGVVPLNFGPLTQSGGERRLNVAVTRARRQVVLFTSFDPQDLRAEQTSSVGVKHLKAYLELAAGTVDHAEDARRTVLTDRHRDEVAAALRSAGLMVTTDVGLSDFRIDLAVSAPGNAGAVAVLLDGPQWYARRTVSDRDSLPLDVLRGVLGWPAVERIWLPEWLADPAAVVDRIRTVAESLDRPAPDPEPAFGSPPEPSADPGPEPSAEPTADPEPDLFAAQGHGGEWQSYLPRQSPPAPEPTSPDPESDRPDTVSDHQSEAPVEPEPQGEADRSPSSFVPWSPGGQGQLATLDALPQRRAAQAVGAMVIDLLTTEGPTHRSRVAKLVAEAHGLTRVAANRADAIIGAVPRECRTRGAEPDFLWPPGVDPVTWRGFRPAGTDPRDVTQVSLEELANALAHVARTSGGIVEQEALRATLALFGGRRLTAAVSDRLRQAVRFALDSGRVRRNDAGVLVAGD